MIDREPFLARVEEYHKGGWRLALINAASVLSNEQYPDGACEISWVFAKGIELEKIREVVLPGDEMPSISPSFGAAFLYENEIRELFGVNVTGINLDLAGQLYKTAEKIPFSPSAIRARLEKAGTLPAAAASGAKQA